MPDPIYRPPEPFRCDVQADGACGRVAPQGELDIETVERVRPHLQELLAAGHDELVLDLRGLTFMDSTGLRLVLEWDAAARVDGFGFAVIPGDGPVLRLFRLSGLENHIRLADA